MNNICYYNTIVKDITRKFPNTLFIIVKKNIPVQDAVRLQVYDNCLPISLYIIIEIYEDLQAIYPPCCTLHNSGCTT